jgi:hypothetical protein
MPDPRRAVLLAALALAACGGSAPESKPAERGLGEQVGDTASDTAALREANEAAGSVVRAAGDCAAVQAALPAATAKLDEVEPRLKTATGRTSLANLRKQLQQVAEACP